MKNTILKFISIFCISLLSITTLSSCKSNKEEITKVENNQKAKEEENKKAEEEKIQKEKYGYLDKFNEVLDNLESYNLSDTKLLGENNYTLYDINKDGVVEMLVSSKDENSDNAINIFIYDKNSEKVVKDDKIIYTDYSNKVNITGLKNSEGILYYELNTGVGDIKYDCYKLKDNKLVKENVGYYKFEERVLDTVPKSITENILYLDWFNIKYRDLLKVDKDGFDSNEYKEKYKKLKETELIDKGYIIYEGVLKIFSSSELVDFQITKGLDKNLESIKNQFEGMDRYYLILALDKPEKVTGRTLDSTRTAETEIIGLAGNTHDLINSIYGKYNNKKIKVAVKSDSLHYPSDSSLPLGTVRAIVYEIIE